MDSVHILWRARSALARGHVLSIGDEGAVGLAEALKVNTALAMLDLRGNPVGDEVIATLVADAQEENTVPTALMLGCNEDLRGAKDRGYRGCQTQSRSGRTCQKWTEQVPHEHTATPDGFLGMGLGDHNFCRNPDGEHTIWCYTTDPNTRWEFCDPLPG